MSLLGSPWIFYFFSPRRRCDSEFMQHSETAALSNCISIFVTGVIWLFVCVMSHWRYEGLYRSFRVCFNFTLADFPFGLISNSVSKNVVRKKQEI